MTQGACLTAIKVLLVFLPVFCFGQTGASQVFTRQNGTGAVLRSVESKLRETVSVTDFGADPTGVADSLAAYNRCKSSVAFCSFPPGVFSFSAPVLLPTGNSGITGTSNAVTTLRYTGTADITDFVLLGGSITYNVTLSGLTIVGNSHVTNVVHALQTDQNSLISNLQIKSATGTCLLVESAVAATFANIGCTDSTGAQSPRPAVGIKVISSNVVIFVNPVVENLITGTGILLPSCVSCKFIGGTSESNGINVDVGSVSNGTQLIGMDNESPCTENVRDAGLNTHIIDGLYAGVSGVVGCSATPPSVHYTSTATGGKTEGIVGDQIIIDSGAKQIFTERNNLGNNFGSVSTVLLDSGTASVSIDDRMCCGGGASPLPNKLPGQTLLGTAGGGNANVMILGQPRMEFTPNNAFRCTGVDTGCAGASANNALVAGLVKPDGTPVTVQAGLRVTIFLGDSLRAGSNTLNLNNSGAMLIVRATDGGNLTVPYIGSGLPVDFLNLGGTAWIAMGSQ